jgi:hypothetical protein
VYPIHGYHFIGCMCARAAAAALAPPCSSVDRWRGPVEACAALLVQLAPSIHLQAAVAPGHSSARQMMLRAVLLAATLLPPLCSSMVLLQSPRHQQPPPAPAAGDLAALGISARDFGAKGDGVWNQSGPCLWDPVTHEKEKLSCPGRWQGTDDTAALQAAIDEAQASGRTLLIPAGHYIITDTLNVSCANEYCSLCPCLTCPCKYPVTHHPLTMRGEGLRRTHICAARRGMTAVLQMAGNWLSGSLAANPGPSYNFTEGHEVSDLHLAANGAADYGIYGPGLIRSLFSRIEVNLAVVAGARLYSCFENGFEDVNFNYAPIGIHSSCNNLRVSGGDFHGHGIVAILIDSGAQVDIHDNTIEGNAGPAIIVAPSTLGYPSAVTIRSNYYELNNFRPIVWEGSGGGPIATCTDLLINGERWDQDIARKIGTRQGESKVVSLR